MKRIIFALLFLISACILQAQNYQVYTVKGEVTVKNGASKEAVEPGMILTQSSILDIPADARIVVLLESKKELHTIKGPAADQLGNIITSESHSTQQLTESYLAFIKQKITDTGASKDKNFKQSAGTSYREADSLLIQQLIPADTSATSNRKKE